jgi:RNA 3'-terminal phosphate cyclase (ATP)
MKAMIELDGSTGEGGGQILRTALSLSMITGAPFRIRNIRAKRAKPGLMRQHLTCVDASRRISQAEVEGAALGSTELVFRPHAITAGDYVFKTGGAGSTTLVFQTVALPLALACTEASTIQFEGGTHNPMAPPVSFLSEVYLPCLHLMGLDLQTTFNTYGFYPAGGGTWSARISPRSKAPRPAFEHTQRGALVSMTATVLHAKLAPSIGHRELHVLMQNLEALDREKSSVQEVPSAGPGNVIALALDFKHSRERLYGFGERMVSAEKVAFGVVSLARQCLAQDVPVSEYLADQLLLPLALTRGGSFRTTELSQHFTTQVQTLAHFLPARVHTEIEPGGTVHVRVSL